MTALLFLVAAAAAAPAAHHPVDRGAGTGTLIGGQQTASPVASIGYIRPPINPTMLEQASVRALQAGRNMFRCIYRNKPTVVAAALSATNAAEFQWRYVIPKNLPGECLVERAGDTVDAMALSFSTFDQVGLLAEAALQRPPAQRLAAMPLAAVPHASAWMTNNQGGQVTMQLATCLAYTQPGPVQGLVGSKPASVDEEAGFAELIPLVPGCLDKNVTLRASKVMLRQALAIALYQRVAGVTVGQEAAK